MRRWSFVLLVVLMPALVVAQDDDPPEEKKDVKEAAMRADLAKIEGVWDLVSREVGGSAIPAEKLGKQTLTIGGPVFIARKDGNVISFSINKVDGRKSPKQITTEVVGGEGKKDRLLGIYEQKDDTLRIIADPEGDFRPREFKTEPNTKQVLSVYKRQTPKGADTINIVGKYTAVSREVDGKQTKADVEIIRRGDTYLVEYRRGPQLAYIGIGIRQGNQFSVCWANRGEIGISVYTIEKGPKLTGGYSKLGGLGIMNPETMTPLVEID